MSTDLELSEQALRIYYASLGKLHSSRIQKGGQRLHRSLMLIQMIEYSSDLYFSALASAQRGHQVADSTAEKRTAAGHQVADSPAETPMAGDMEDEHKESVEAYLAISQ
ncbi:immediate early response gene 2 protein-like isoform X2 [Festucalex cinctus]